MLDTTEILIYGNIFLLFLLFYSFLFKNKLFIKFQIIVYLLICSLFISLRDLVGADTLTYIGYFHYYGNFETVYNSYFAWKGDYFFFLLGWLIKLFTDSERVYIFLLDFFGISVLFFGFYRIIKMFNLENVFLIVMFFTFTTSSFIFLYANVIRQGIAASFIVLAISYFLNKNNKIGIFFFILAFLTHKSSFVFLPIFLVVFYWEIQWKYIIMISFSSLLVGKLKLITRIADFNIAFLSDKILNYQNASQANLNLKLTILLINTLVFSFFLNKNNIYDKIFKIWILLFSVVLFTSEIEKFASRLILYNDILTPLIYGCLLFFMKKKKYFPLVLFSELLFVIFYGLYIYGHPSIINTLQYSLNSLINGEVFYG